MKCGPGLETRDLDEVSINIDPIQVGGRLTPEAMKAVIAYGDGYSVCDNCRKPFRLDAIRSPPIDVFHRELAKFLNMDVARVVPGARRGFQAVANTYVEKGDPVILTSLSHYTEFLAVEAAGGIPREIPANEAHVVTGEAAAAKIEEVEREFSRSPALLFIDHFDYQYGNEHDVQGVIRAAKAHDVPVLYNGAYTVGIMEVDGKALGADFVVGSGHKSMAAPAPSGPAAPAQQPASELAPAGAQPSPQRAIQSTTPPAPQPAPAAQAATNTEEVTSPMVGTFYLRSRPESPPFIKPGDVVDPGQTLCIVEAMKLMNEIQAEKKCRIVDILVEDGESVEYGQPLVVVEPL